MNYCLALSIYLLGIFSILLAIAGKGGLSLLFLVSLLPLQNVIEKMHQFPAGKDFVDILFVAIIIGWIVKAITRKERIFERNPFNLTLFALIILTYLSLWRGSSFLGFPAPVRFNDPRVMTWKNYMLLPVLYFITVNNIKDLKWLKRLFWVMLFSMLIMDYYTANQIRWFSGLASRDKIDGTFVFLGPNEVAAFYAHYSFVLLGIFLLDKVRTRRILFIGVIVLNFYCLLFLFSRGAYFAVLTGLIFIGFIKCRKLLVPLFFLLIFWQAILPAEVVERINMTETAEGELESSAESRVEMWKASIKLFERNPVIGVGFNVFPYLGYKLKDTHNIYVKVLTEQGILGMLVFFFMFYLALKSGWQLYKTSNDNFLKGLGLGVVACIIATMTTNFFGDRWTYTQLGAYYWVFLAMVVRGNILVREELEQEKKMEISGDSEAQTV